MLRPSLPVAREACCAVLGALFLRSLASSAPTECNRAADPQCLGQDDGMTSLLQTVPAKAEKQALMKPMSDSQSASPIHQSNQNDPTSLAGSGASVEAAMSSHQTYDKVIIAKQTASQCYMDAATRDTFKMIPHVATTWGPCYMNLDALNELGAKADGTSYRLELIWVLDDDSIVDVVWTQTSSLMESTIRGFNAISADAINAHEYSSGATCAKFDGLGKSPEGACVLDGNGNGDCFFNCAGTVVQWNGEDFIPGPMERKAKSFALYLLVLPRAHYRYQLLARQIPGQCYMNAFAKRSWRQSSDYRGACYMNLDPLMESGAKADGSSYRFDLMWTLDDDSIVSAVWTQTSLPMYADITGFQAINQFAVDANGYAGGATCAKFEGLGKSADGLCILDGNGGGDCFFNCVGTLGQWNQENFIPGPMERKAKKVELYLVMRKTYEPAERFNYELLARQVPAQCHFDSWAKQYCLFNSHDPNAACYMNMNPLIGSAAQMEGAYRLMLKWKLDDGMDFDVIWEQWTDPRTNEWIHGYKAINVNAMALERDYVEDCSKFRGIALSANAQCVLDGTGSSDQCYWNCVGLIHMWQGGFIPGPMERRAQRVELWVINKRNIVE